MKQRIFSFSVAVILCGFAFLGCYFRGSYTDLTNDEDYWDRFLVAEMPESIGIQCCHRLRTSLPEAPIVARVSAIGMMEHLFGISRQKVMVKEVFSGEQLLKEQEIYLTSQNWSIIIQENECSIELGFVNMLKEGKEYLVFLSGQVHCLDEEIPVYQLYDNEYILPIFCYENIENTVIPVGVPTYVSYTEVKNNEFFATTEKVLSTWLELKESMIKMYPIGHEST